MHTHQYHVISRQKFVKWFWWANATVLSVDFHFLSMFTNKSNLLGYMFLYNNSGYNYFQYHFQFGFRTVFKIGSKYFLLKYRFDIFFENIQVLGKQDQIINKNTYWEKCQHDIKIMFELLVRTVSITLFPFDSGVTVNLIQKFWTSCFFMIQERTKDKSRCLHSIYCVFNVFSIVLV